MTATEGFVMIPNWLLDDSDLSRNELLVYMVLLRFRDHRTGECFPGLSTIADRARLSRDTVKRTIPLLEQKGMVAVRRRKQGTKNLPNVYRVAVPRQDRKRPAFESDTSEGGGTTPLPPVDNSKGGGCTMHLGRCTMHLGVGAPCTSNKNQITRSNEQDMTHDFSEVTFDAFSFDLEHPLASEAQVNYLKDLATHLSYEAGGGTPDDTHLTRWRGLTREEATQLIHGYLKQLGRPDEIYYPEPGTPEYEALSEAGKAFADEAGMPDSVFEYGFGLKENAA